VRIEVDGGGFTSAVDDFYQANHGVVAAVTKLSGTLGGSGGMAGHDTGGQAWAEQYDQAAGPLLQTGCQVGEAMAQMANLLDASLSNHEGADYGSRVYGPPMGGGTPDDAGPGHWSETLSAADPPSAYGGTGDQPGWWHWIAGHVGGLLWPDADTGRLRATGDAWKTAGQQVSLYSAHVDSARGQISLQRSKEIPHAVAVCDKVSSHMTDLATAYSQIGQACTDYAAQVDEHHQQIEDELTSFVEWTVGIEVGGALLGAVTLGIGEAAAQAAEAAKVAEAAGKVISILNRLIELARLAALRIGEVVGKVGELTQSLKSLLNAKVIRALEKVAPGLAEDLKFMKTVPEWAKGGKVPVSGPGSEIYAEGVERYGGLTRKEFLEKYWNPETKSWRYPPEDGFAGEALPNSLSRGDVIDRLGPDTGEFASPAGSGYGERAIPPSSIGRDYHQYEVVKPLPEAVTEGKIAPWFEQPGGAVQYKFDHPVSWYVKNGYLKEVP
jgi:hypothetical protein